MKLKILFWPAAILFILLVRANLVYAQIENPANTGKLIRQDENIKDTARINLLLALSQELVKTQPREAYIYASEAYNIAITLNDNLRRGLASSSLAEVYLNSAVYDKALQYYLDALDLFRLTGDTLQMAKCYNDIGIVHMSSGDYKEAMKNYRTAFQLNKLKRNPRNVARNYMNMGLSYLKSDSVDKGLTYLLASLMIADSLGMKEEKMVLMKNIGYGYSRMGKYEEALGHFYKVLELTGDKNDFLNRSEAQINIADGYFNLKNYPAAKKYAHLGYELAKSKHFNRIYRDAAAMLSSIYAAEGNYQTAWEFSNINRAISDTIINTERIEQIARMQTIYDVNLKEQENLQLKDQLVRHISQVKTRTFVIIVITILVILLGLLLFLLNQMNNRQISLNKKLSRQGLELESLNDLKDKFFSFVAHNLKNPFNTIMGFSNLMQRAADSGDTNKTREYANLIHDLSSQVQKVLSNLLEWSRLQRRTFEVKPETVELTSLIKDVVEMNNKEAARKDISLALSNEGSVFVVADRTMITTVLQNLVSNAIHYTQPSGRISIHTKVKNQFTEVSITDTGIGIPADKLSRLFDFDFSQSKIGLSDHGGSGLGLVICHEMLHKNGGSIYATSEVGKGSRFVFTLPVAIRHDQLEESRKDHPENTPDDFTENLLSSDIPVNEELLTELKTNIVPQFEEVSKVLSIENLDHFSKTLISAGEKHRHLALSGYGKSLHSLTVGHQIDQIIRILPRFREYLRKIHIL